jgi:hypothetical protein
MMRVLCTGFVVLAILVMACSTASLPPLPTSSTFACPAATSPCGNGCMPSGSSVCCDTGALTTSSYCVDTGGGGCSANAGTCKTPQGTGPADFCCGNATFGSDDCPSDQHHCGLQCWPLTHACCAAGSTTAACPETSWDPVGCTLPGAGDIGCAVCVETQQCMSCASGSCCHGDPCAGGGCTVDAFCVGAGGGNTGTGSGGGSGSCPVTFAQCCSGNAGNQCAPDRGGCPNSLSSCPTGTGAFVCNGDPNGCGGFYNSGEVYCTCT